MSEDLVKSIRIKIESVGAHTTQNEIEDLRQEIGKLGPEATEAAHELEDALNRVSTKARGTSDEFSEMVQRVNRATDAYRELAQAAVLAGSTSPTGDVALGVSESEARQGLAVLEAQRLTAASVYRQVVKEAEAAAKAQARASEEEAKQYQEAINRKIASEDALAARRKKAQEDIERVAAAERASMAAGRADRDASIAAYDRQQQAMIRQRLETEAASKATTSMAGSLPRLRYALYDVSTTLAFTGAAMLALSGATVAASIAMDRQFADVIRTTGTYMDSTGAQTANLRDEFNQLFSTLPASWANLTEIGTLAGQLGIASENVAEFTGLVAKFASVTDVSVEASATAFGRLAELLDVPATEFENLGSSILKVGVNSVATESQIINTASQIASMGDFAGFSADEVFGLSAALASLGVQPELSRGVITRLFTNITKSISDGGDRLEVFGRLAGTTGQEFAQAWGDDAAGALQDLLAGLGNVEESGAIAALEEMGITASRDIPTILKLAQNTDVLAQAMADAESGYAEGTALQDQYAVVAQTVAERLTILKNNFQLLFAELGSGSSVLGTIIDGLTTLVRGLTTLAGNETVQRISAIVIGLTALGGIIAIVAGGFARGVASAAAFRTSLIEIAGAAYTAKTGLDAASASTISLIGASQGLKAALISTGIGAAVVVLGTALAYFVGQSANAQQANQELADSFDRVTGAATETTRQIAFNSLVSSGAVAGAKALGIDLGVLTDAWLGNKDAIDQVSLVTQAAIDASNGFASGQDEAALAAQNLASGAEDVNEAIGAGNGQMSEAQVLARDQAEAMRESADGTSEAADSMFDLEDGAESAADALGDAVNEALSLLNAEYALIGATYDLGGAIAENGLDFSDQTVAGRANLESLASAIGNAAQVAGGDAELFAAYVQNLIGQLTALGVQGAASIAPIARALASLGNVVPSAAGMAIAEADIGGQLAAGFQAASYSAQDFGRRGSSAAKKVQKEVRTLSDYVSDLEKVFSDAFDFRFGFGQSQDETRSAMRDIQDSFEAAREKVRDLRLEIGGYSASIRGLRSDRNILEYQLSVAREYGDTLREQDILAELAENQADLRKAEQDRADAQKELREEQEKAIPSLTGTTEAAADQRAAVLDLVESYQQQITAYANTGASQQQVEQYARRLRGEFVQQLTQLGYNRAEVDKYAKSFDDVITIINRLPRNITVSVNANPALRALDEFLAKAKKTGSQASDAIRGGGGKGYTPAIPKKAVVQVQFKMPSYEQLMKMQAYIRKATGDPAFRIGIPAGQGGQTFAQGGYTGPGGMYEPAGTVHRGEYVIPKKDVNQRTGLPYADAFARLSRGTGGSGYANGGYVQPSRMVVELGPQSMRAIEAGANVNLYIDSEKVASSTNKANAFTTSVRGKN